MQAKVLFLSALLASAGAFAADASAGGDVQPTSYAYGMNLDVAEVISIQEEPHDRCQPVNTRMTYRDSQGEVRAVEYVKQDAFCE